MAHRRSKKDRLQIHARYFRWILSARRGVWQADGRGNNPNAGRHSLGTRDIDQARQVVHDLDLQKAVEFGMASRSQLQNDGTSMLDFQEGVREYEEYLERPAVAHGPKSSTKKRYHRIIRALKEFVRERRIKFWDQFDQAVLNDYVNFRSKKCKHSSIVTELSMIKTVLKFLRENGHLSNDRTFTYGLRRPKESTKYCPEPEEVAAILNLLTDNKKAKWIHDVVLMLAYTGLRFSELAQLTADDIDSKFNFIAVRDETFEQGTKSTKTGYARKVPIHSELRRLVAHKVESDPDGLFRGPRGGKLDNDLFGKRLRSLALGPLRKRFTHRRFQTITAHSFRHFFASYCAAQGIAQQTVMEWMGHRTDSMAKRYFHSNDAASLRNIQRLKSLSDDANDSENPKNGMNDDD